MCAALIFSDADLTGTKISEANIDGTTILTGARIDDDDLAVLARAGLRQLPQFEFNVDRSRSLDLAELTVLPPPSR